MTFDTATVDAAAAKNTFTGVVTLHVDERREFERSYGFAHRALGVANTPATRFAIASGGKSFTALAVMRLVEQGKLRLDDRVRNLLGTDLPLIDDAVTIEHLLTHTSGIGDYLDEEADWEADDYVLTVPVHTLTSAEAFLPVIDGFPQAFPPGDHFTYCNGGYMVLAVIVERASGQGYHDYVEHEVCARAGLTSTGFPRSDELPANAALGYLYEEGDRTNLLHLPVRGNGDGGIYTNADDLHRFWVAFLDGRIVSPASVQEMIRPRHDVPGENARSAMGFQVHPSAPLVIMEGYDAGVSFQSTHNTATKSTLSILGNSSEGAWPVMGALQESDWSL